MPRPLTSAPAPRIEAHGIPAIPAHSVSEPPLIQAQNTEYSRSKLKVVDCLDCDEGGGFSLPSERDLAPSLLEVTASTARAMVFPVFLAIALPIGAIKISQTPSTGALFPLFSTLSSESSSLLSLAKHSLNTLFTPSLNADTSSSQIYSEALLTEVRSFEEEAHASALLEELSKDVELTLRKTEAKIAAREKRARKSGTEEIGEKIAISEESLKAPLTAHNTQSHKILGESKRSEASSARASLKRSSHRFSKGSSIRDTASNYSAEQRNTILFIAGKIAIYQPELKDVGRIARELVELSEKEGLDPFFIAAIVSVESRFLERARSSAGATGLMQLMPATAKFVAKNGGISTGQALTDSRYNLALGIHYIRSLEEQFRGNRFLALAAYNWGPTNVTRVRTQSNIPRSVQNYASTIIKRSRLWRSHYEKTLESVTEHEQMAMLSSPKL